MPTLVNEDQETITFDNVLSESYAETAMVTDHPIANSANVTDHRQIKPRLLTLEVLVTETPFEGQEHGVPVIEVGNVGELGAPRAITYLQRIRAFAEAGVLIYSSKRLGSLANLMLESMEYTVENRWDLIIKLELKEVFFAEGVRVDLPKVKVRRTRPSVCPVVKQGDQRKEELATPIIFTEEELYPPNDVSMVHGLTEGARYNPNFAEQFNAAVN